MARDRAALHVAGSSIQGHAHNFRQPSATLTAPILTLRPLQPTLTCEVAGVDAEGTLSWLSRKAAQGFDHGIPGWLRPERSGLEGADVPYGSQASES